MAICHNLPPKSVMSVTLLFPYFPVMREGGLQHKHFAAAAVSPGVETRAPRFLLGGRNLLIFSHELF
jgi:hypothetical protein